MNLAALVAIPLKGGELRPAPDSIHWDIARVLGHDSSKTTAKLSHSARHVLVVCPRVGRVIENAPERIVHVSEVAIVEVARPDILN
jgi:hypothetical protein